MNVCVQMLCSYTYGNLVPSSVVIEVQGLQQLAQCVLQRFNQEGSASAASSPESAEEPTGSSLSEGDAQ